MNLFEPLTRIRTSRQIKVLAGRVAHASFAPVYERLSPSAFAMNRSEARGYVRARAGAVVQREMERVLAAEGRLSPWGRSRLHQTAIASVVDEVLDLLFRRDDDSTLLRRAG